MLGAAADLTPAPFPSAALLRHVHAGQPRGAAPGRAIDRHGPQRAALCLVGRTWAPSSRCVGLGKGHFTSSVVSAAHLGPVVLSESLFSWFSPANA